jgi:hypothetical protein
MFCPEYKFWTALTAATTASLTSTGASVKDREPISTPGHSNVSYFVRAAKRFQVPEIDRVDREAFIYLELQLYWLIEQGVFR